ncbi:bZIP transcription factor AP-1/Yap1 [Trichophyton equinum CBS 127.97]|uniref:BZIP transcription factor AP-1/Yap1 n=1 Tax=Trichophyton equinum (strain ATCC MYA-4606 / CBS 127.97) TaxID=559882 RepID=F2PP75_TRIEC|nr:bZIP transcription factor AP-1/Yap1 [Trichophyton equinum CBS 127.97]
MAEFDPSFQRSLYLSPDQQDLLLAALSSNNPPTKPGPQPNLGSTNGSSGNDIFDSPPQDIPGSGQLSFNPDDSPFLGLDLDAKFDVSDQALIGGLPGIDGEQQIAAEPREKRKSLDGGEGADTGKKRKENEEKVAKKPGRKPLTSEPTTKRKAQNRAAQRAFRDRKEKHLKDLETKVADLERASQTANQENTLLRAHIQRLQVELKEYRKRLSWISSGNSFSPTTSLLNQARSLHAQARLNNDFSFDFPKFGDLPGAHMNNIGSLAKGTPNALSQTHPALGIKATSHIGTTPQFTPSNGSAFRQNGQSSTTNKSHEAPGSTYTSQNFETSPATFSESPSASSESQHISSICTSPESSLTSPTIAQKGDASNSAQANGNGNAKKNSPSQCELKFYQQLGEACGCVDNPIPAALAKKSSQGSTNPKSPENAVSTLSPANSTPTMSTSTASENTNNTQTASDPSGKGSATASSNVLSDPSIPSFDWLAQQNGGHFDPVLFGDYRDPQDAVLSQDFSGFFDDAFPLPDLGAFDAATPGSTAKTPGKTDAPATTVDIDDDEEVVPGEDRSQMLSCTKIWDRLQRLEKFRNGEIDVDNLCTQLRTKARCSEGGVVIDQKDVDDIVTRAI